MCGQPGHVARDCRSGNGRGAPHEQVSPLRVSNVVAAACTSAAILKGRIGDIEVDTHWLWFNH